MAALLVAGHPQLLRNAFVQLVHVGNDSHQPVPFGKLSEGNRLVGIISHVDKLDESIPQKLRVTCDEKGSHVRAELS